MNLKIGIHCKELFSTLGFIFSDNEGIITEWAFAYDHYYINNKQYYKDFEVKHYDGKDAEGNDLYTVCEKKISKMWDCMKVRIELYIMKSL